MNALELRVGAAAAARLDREGWHPDLLAGLLGASGGPKWLILGQLDRALHRYLMAQRTQPLAAVGSSIGAWRHAFLAQADPVAAIDRFEEVYLRQEYGSGKPDVADVTRISEAMLTHALGEAGAAAVVNHPWMRSYIVTARGRGLNASVSGPGLALGLGIAALGNGVTRATLQASFQRVVFTHPLSQPINDLLTGFRTRYVPLTEAVVPKALMASGAIPYLFEGGKDLPGGPPGAYWDGGIIDYHFSIDGLCGEGIWLFPHFDNRVTRGWFDKFLPWRAGRQVTATQLIMVCPSQEFLASLPLGKIPDRRDFGRMSEPDRLGYWRTCVAESQRLADEFAALVTGNNPLRGAVLV